MSKVKWERVKYVFLCGPYVIKLNSEDDICVYFNGACLGKKDTVTAAKLIAEKHMEDCHITTPATNRGMNDSDELWAPMDTPIAARMVEDCINSGIEGKNVKFIDGSAPALLQELGKVIYNLRKLAKELQDDINERRANDEIDLG